MKRLGSWRAKASLFFDCSPRPGDDGLPRKPRDTTERSASRLWTHGIPLVTKVGADVKWVFEPTAVYSSLAIIEIAADPPPFGAK